MLRVKRLHAETPHWTLDGFCFYILMFYTRVSCSKVTLCLCRSLLPPQFPQEKPVVSVYPPVGHHLVDSNNGTMISSPLVSNVRLFVYLPLKWSSCSEQLCEETLFLSESESGNHHIYDQFLEKLDCHILVSLLITALIMNDCFLK